MPKGREGRPLIAAGGTAEIRLPAPVRAAKTVGGFSPAQPQSQQVVIAMAVFEDGSYEGEPQRAAEFMAFQAGRKKQISSIVAALNGLDLASSDPLATVAKLREQIAALGDAVGGSILDKLLTDYSIPNDERPRVETSIQAAMHNLKKTTMDEVNGLEKSQTQSPDARAL